MHRALRVSLVCLAALALTVGAFAAMVLAPGSAVERAYAETSFENGTYACQGFSASTGMFALNIDDHPASITRGPKASSTEGFETGSLLSFARRMRCFDR